MEFRVTDLLIEAAKAGKRDKKKPLVPEPGGPKLEPCGRPSTCYGCTLCTSTAMSQHKPAATYNTCDFMLHDAEIRAQLLAQLRETLAVSGEVGESETREAA